MLRLSKHEKSLIGAFGGLLMVVLIQGAFFLLVAMARCGA
jgi:hypothetical protein